MTYWRFSSETRALQNNRVYVDLRNRDPWLLYTCSRQAHTLCEIIRNTPVPPIPTQAYVNLKNLISQHANDSSHNTISQRFDSLERRLEQMSNVVINRQDVLEEIRSGMGISNNTEIKNAFAELSSEQNSVSDSIEDIKRMMAIFIRLYMPRLKK